MIYEVLLLPTKLNKILFRRCHAKRWHHSHQINNSCIRTHDVRLHIAGTNEPASQRRSAVYDYTYQYIYNLPFILRHSFMDVILWRKYTAQSYHEKNISLNCLFLSIWPKKTHVSKLALSNLSIISSWNYLWPLKEVLFSLMRKFFNSGISKFTDKENLTEEKRKFFRPSPFPLSCRH